MKKNIFLGLFFIFSYLWTNGATGDPFVLDISILNFNKNEIAKGNRHLIQAKNELINEADKVMSKKEAYSVTFKTQTPPSGSKNDYYSLARYYWPNKNKRSNSSYVYRDGVVNPEINSIPDHDMLANISSDVYTLGLAYYFSGEEKYVTKINSLIKVFFVDARTKMNPNLKFAQLIKGSNKNSNVTIGAVSFVNLIDGLQLVSNSKSVDSQSFRSVRGWFGQFANWIVNQKSLDKERYANNNTGIYYTVQVTTYSMFSGNQEYAKTFFSAQSKRIIKEQIDSEGKLVNELKRAKPWDYVSYTVSALSDLHSLSNRLSIPVQGIDKVFDWLKPYANGKVQWNYSKGNGAVSSRNVAKVLMRSPAFTKSNDRIESYTKANYLELLTTQIGK